ncbi:MAG: hypothetical protein IMX01_08805 [Limnochordaceae bacterium]|nr:hypothetical protein [Limnochordaceae bacterium]
MGMNLPISSAGVSAGQSGQGPAPSGRRIPASNALGEWMLLFDLYLRLPRSVAWALFWGGNAALLLTIPCILFWNWAAKNSWLVGWQWALLAWGAGLGLAALRRRSVCRGQFFVLPMLWVRTSWDGIATMIGFPLVVVYGAWALQSHFMQAMLLTMIPVFCGGLIAHWLWEHVYYVLLRLFAQVDRGGRLREQIVEVLRQNAYTAPWLPQITIHIPWDGAVELSGVVPSLTVRNDILRTVEAVQGVSVVQSASLIVSDSLR